MKAIAALTGADAARGLALAGLLARAPRDRAAVEAALAESRAHRPPIGLLLIAPEVAALAPRALEAFTAEDDAPAVLVLPGP